MGLRALLGIFIIIMKEDYEIKNMTLSGVADIGADALREVYDSGGEVDMDLMIRVNGLDLLVKEGLDFGNSC